MKKLRELFFGKASKQKADVDLEAKKQKDLARLESWIFEAAVDIENKSSEIKQQKKQINPSHDHNYHFLVNIDFDQFTRKDLSVLKAACERLHDVCQKENIAVNIAGFDLLPYTSLSSIAGPGSYSPRTENHILISVNRQQDYNYTVNPFSSHIANKKKPDNNKHLK